MRIVTSILALLLVTACDREGTTPTPDTAATSDTTSETTDAKNAPSKHEDPAFAVSLAPQEPYSVGKESKLDAVLEARGEYHCNDEYPYKFKLDPAPEGVSYAADVAKDIEKGEKRSVLPIKFTAKTPGKKKIGGTFYFSVCNKEHCKIDKKPMSITVDVPAS